MKSFMIVVFGVGMLALGTVALAFTLPLWRIVRKIIEQGKPEMSLAPTTETLWSMRFGGAIAIMMGAFVLWMSLRSR